MLGHALSTWTLEVLLGCILHGEVSEALKVVGRRSSGFCSSWYPLPSVRYCYGLRSGSSLPCKGSIGLSTRRGMKYWLVRGAANLFRAIFKTTPQWAFREEARYSHSMKIRFPWKLQPDYSTTLTLLRPKPPYTRPAKPEASTPVPAGRL